MLVTLTTEQQAIAYRRAATRLLWKQDGQRPHRRVGLLQGDQVDPGLELDSAGAEVAVAGLLEVGLPPAERPCYDGDLLNGDEVRQTRHMNGHLIVYPEDPDERRYWLVTGTFPEYNVAGWAYGREAKGLPLESKRAGASEAHWLPQRLLTVAFAVLILALLLPVSSEARPPVPAPVFKAVRAFWKTKAERVEAFNIVACETGNRYNTTAANGQYLGLFQMGSFARARYGHSWTAWGQARAAHRYYLEAGWSPWSCA